MSRQYNPDELEKLVGRALRGQRSLHAPASLQSRVFDELARRAALPWWHKSFAHWPLAVRGVFALACVTIAAFVLTGASWVVEAAAGPAASVRSTAQVANSLGSAGAALIHSIPSQWLFVGAAFSLVLYIALFGLGATAYRTLYK